METIKLNDTVYSKFGYGVVVNTRLEPPPCDDSKKEADREALAGPENPEKIQENTFLEIKFDWGGTGFI